MRTLMRLCVLCLTNIGFVSAFPSGSLFLKVCNLMFVTFCYAYFGVVFDCYVSARCLLSCLIVTLVRAVLCCV